MNARKGLAILLLLTSGINSSGWSAFSSHGSVAISASVTLPGLTPGNIVVTPLPTSAFFGKNVVIPVQITGGAGSANTNNRQVTNRPSTTANISVDFIYQLIDVSGNPIGSIITVPVTFSGTSGSVVILASDLQAIQHGGSLQYIFQIQQGGSRTLWTQAGSQRAPGAFSTIPSPFQTTIIDTLCQPVSPAGSQISVPDLFEHDGQTTVVLGPGAISAPGTLCIKQEDPTNWPLGPGGTSPAAIYTVTLDNASLVQSAQIVLSYPSDVNGNVLNLKTNPNDLGIYWLGPEGLPLPDQSWRVLSLSQVDTTLHTVTGVSGHFSTFGLYAAGATTNADLRPAERIITPNGDGKNDAAHFGQGIDQVKIFDIRGRRVKTIPGPDPQWDGTNDGGSIVESGIYIYQYTSQGGRVSGVIMVAK